MIPGYLSCTCLRNTLRMYTSILNLKDRGIKSYFVRFAWFKYFHFLPKRGCRRSVGYLEYLEFKIHVDRVFVDFSAKIQHFSVLQTRHNRFVKTSKLSSPTYTIYIRSDFFTCNFISHLKTIFQKHITLDIKIFKVISTNNIFVK